MLYNYMRNKNSWMNVCTGDQEELHFKVTGNVFYLNTLWQRGKVCMFQSSVCVCVCEQRLTPSDTCRRASLLRGIRRLKCNLSVSEPQRKNKHTDRINTDSRGWTNMYLGGGEKHHKWICCLTGVEYSRTNLIAAEQGTVLVSAWWWWWGLHVDRDQALCRSSEIQRSWPL